MRRFALVLILLSSVVGIQAQPRTPFYTVIATHPILADIAQQVGGDRIEVRSLVPIGMALEDYEITADDLEMVNEADLLMISGGGLEPFLFDLVDNTDTPVVIASEGLDMLGWDTENTQARTIAHTDVDYIGRLIDDVVCDQLSFDNEVEAVCNPYWWFDPFNVTYVASNIEFFFDDLDPGHDEIYEENNEIFREKVLFIDDEIEAELLLNNVTFITASDERLAYFAKRYSLDLIIDPQASALDFAYTDYGDEDVEGYWMWFPEIVQRLRTTEMP
jgi:ABC-type Zn uptake system ZnuABC Zn-binding protein ZnuA